MATAGGRKLAEKLDELRTELQLFFGRISEEIAGLKPDYTVDKPKALLLTEQCIALNLPLVQGAIMDQPYIWMREYHICIEMKTLYESMWEANRKVKEGDK